MNKSIIILEVLIIIMLSILLYVAFDIRSTIKLMEMHSDPTMNAAMEEAIDNVANSIVK